MTLHLFKLQIVQWDKTVEDKYCLHSDSHRNVSNQEECQSLCMNLGYDRTFCVGIAYSYKPSYRQYCYLCRNDVLSSNEYGYAFYRRKGSTSFQWYSNIQNQT